MKKGFFKNIEELKASTNDSILDIQKAHRITIDSIHGKSVRILKAELRSKSKKQLESSITDLSRHDIWEEEEEENIAKSKASKLVGVKPEELAEGRVFVLLQDTKKKLQKVETSREVRQVVRSAYNELVSREGLRIPAKKEGET